MIRFQDASGPFPDPQYPDVPRLTFNQAKLLSLCKEVLLGDGRRKESGMRRRLLRYHPEQVEDYCHKEVCLDMPDRKTITPLERRGMLSVLETRRTEDAKRPWTVRFRVSDATIRMVYGSKFYAEWTERLWPMPKMTDAQCAALGRFVAECVPPQS